MPDLNEAKTRALLINPRLERANWNLSDHSQVQFEVPVKGYDPTPWNGFTDFCLYDVDGSVLAVIEAKRTARNARDGEEQLRQYVTEISAKQDFSPFGFMTNGLHHFFWEVGLAHPRSIAGFFSADDLRRLRFIRQHKMPLKDTPINAAGKEGLFTDGDWILSENMAKDGTIGVIQLKHLGVGEFLNKEFQFISDQTFHDLGCTEVRPGDVLISRMADPIARACVVPRLPFRTVTAVDVSILRVDDSVADGRFITQLCNSRLVRNQVERVARGTTRSRITRTELGEIRIPLPSLREQQRIAGLLEQAERLRRTRRYALQMCDELLPAAFLEMFGDPVRNSRSWPVRLVSEVGEVQGGLQQIARREALPLKKPFLRVANVQRGVLDLADIRLIGLTEAEFSRTMLQKGDLLLVEGNGNPSEVGRAGMWDGSIDECVHQNHLIRIRCDKAHILPVFLLALLNSKRGTEYYLKHGRTTSGLVTISTGLVNDFPTLVPPLQHQRSFAETVTIYERLRAIHAEALRQAEHLSQTLLHQVFSAQ
jgi:type I restriction enzyme, S subunit